MNQTDWNQFATPTLMRAARGVYAQAIRAELEALGIDDLPRNGVFVLTGIDTREGPRQDLPSELGVTKQAVSQLVDILVNRGYLRRRSDPADRRRVLLELTDAGQAVVDASVRGVDAVDHKLEATISKRGIEALRAALIALTKIKVENIATGEGRRRRRRAPQLRSFSPIFPVRDLRAALGHYAKLGFTTLAYEDGDEYGFADRDGTGLHLATIGPDEVLHPGSAYLYVRDADALYDEWSRSGVGLTRAVGPTPYKLREGSHVDPDGNLIRFGSPMEA